MTDLPHERYINAVAHAVRAAGLDGPDWWADSTDPMTGCIEVDEPGLSERTLSLAWSEENGWYYGQQDEHGELLWIEYMTGGVLPTPGEVTEWILAALRDGVSPTVEPPRFRNAEDDPDGFAEQLRQAGEAQ